ncbi:MAG: 4-hydroxy-tetrahydrodipicolinate reductase [Metallibacterium scheffleri]|jgi:4-hydroxy-tetrahydrodipicolinate reductase|uniref:4-hydroxy-tetrahydrodipicolinate reductase n=1 Tax=Metallibacterium scheffleri TaxID=993689 RepID=UPI0026EFE28E|nr:4-hydroxy-tetrahydrodipicolinate reductase [Metallibacterium scheffleri]MCK9365810.1 4-hydroxy-tetrahydrodipicolinate reductase [Metallibacterium scheffleri]
MTEPVRIAIHGAAGRMGRSLIELTRLDARLKLAAALVAPGSTLEGTPLSSPAVPGALAYRTHLGDVGAQVLVDFSSAVGFDRALALCMERGTALVSGTTGLSAAQWAALDAAAVRIAVLHAANFSLGISLLTRLLRAAAAALPDWDIEILEAHHARKEDAPSGTALALGEAAAAARGRRLADVMQVGRHGHTGPRPPGEIGFAVLRGGDVVGEHGVWLLGAGERIELNHRAGNRAIFARGALAAALWMARKPPGRYELEQVLGPG